MKAQLRILHLEDDVSDAELIQETLVAEGLTCQITRVETAADFNAALYNGVFDLILADYTLPSFDGLSALKIARQNCPHVPFIFISGTLDEEVAIEALKVGATDYVFKTRLSRTVPSVQRALREAQERVELSRSEQALRRSEAYLAEAQKLSHTGSFGWDVSTGEIYWSEETFRIFGYEPSSKITVELVVQRTHPEDRLAVKQLIERVSREKKDWDFEHRLMMSDGAVKYLRVMGHPSAKEADGWEFVGAVTDITERRRAEEELQQSKSYLAEAQTLTHSGSWVWQVDGRNAVHLSDEWYRIYGFDPAMGMPDWSTRLERVHPEDRSNWQGTIEQAIREQSDYDVEFRILLPDGQIKFIHTVGHPILDAAGELVQFLGSSMDITERKRAELELRRSETYLAEAQRLSHTGSWAVQVPQMENIYWSQEMYRIFGLQPGPAPPSYAEVARRLHPEDAPYHTIVEQAVRDRTDFETDYRMVLPDGTTRYIHVVGHPVVNASGDVGELVGTAMDVTEQREAQSALEVAFAEIKTLKDQLYKENIALREEVDKVSMFEEIVGSSEPLRKVLEQVAKVAATDSTVLILGETGTGKEMIARAIHRRSNRSARAFIRVNCAAIPPTLIASELFGHEKGAFTGATQRRLGRFELADGGTIFLDEIGELPPETQSALLRVLQEREFERVGSSRSVPVDVRVLSATNRDLMAAVQAGTFREDLFYRLNVFPIQMPPLRERVDDIPLLIEYLVERYAKKAGKKIKNIERKTLDLFRAYDWPGNIRELQNVVERAVILCDGETFFVDETWLKRETPRESVRSDTPFAKLGRLLPEQEKEMIEAALAESRGRVSGPAGAAAMLGLPRQTLESKIASLGINKHKYKTV